MKKMNKEKVIYLDSNLACMDTTALHQLYKDLQKANRMLTLQKKKLVEEKNSLKRWGDDLSLLNDLSKSLVATLDTDQIISTAYTRIQEVVPHDILSIALFSQKKLWLFSNVKLNVEEIEEIKSAIVSALKEVTDSGDSNAYKTAVKYVEDEDHETTSDYSLRKKEELQFANRLFFPLDSGGNKIGMLKLIRYSDEPFSKHQYDILSMIVSTLTLALRNSEIHREAQAMATIDSLTGLFNKRYFNDILDREFKGTMRYQTPVSLIMMDLDNFKTINDMYGHQAGDAVIKEISSMLTKSLRDIDVPARYGGDELAIILPETDAEQAFFVAKRLKRLIEQNPIKFKGNSIKVTASIGISSCPNSSIKTVEDMISEADKALYDAKKCGRNRIESKDNIFNHDNAFLGPLVF
ncbi:MAG: GGDEF domain-containing protein [Nitrospirae bacterium]|nr:GGDEF domain-containing protein [Nitrospirota bacterium]